MTRQAAENATALWTRLQSVFNDDPRTQQVESAAGQAGWPNGWASDISDVRSIVVHSTDGWPTRDKSNEFVQQYTNSSPQQTKRGIGPHFYMPYDGTVFRLLSENRETWHATHVNGWAIGVETGNLMQTGRPQDLVDHWPGGAGHRWTPLRASPDDDVPGAKFYAQSVNGEILVALWSTNRTTQIDSSPDGTTMMLFSEAQYRSWALLARWLAEVWRIPRNFSVRPHLMRGQTWPAGQWRTYRQVVDADPMRDMHIRTQLQPATAFNCPPATYESDDPATGLPHVYQQGVATTTWVDKGVTHHKQINGLWTVLFNSYRGFHGHGFSGANTFDDHNCPGAHFDWHRFARDVWDYWWYPFDLSRANPTARIASGQGARDYGWASGVLAEHYFDHDASLYGQITPTGFFPVGAEIHPHFLPGPPLGLLGELNRMFRHYWGFWHGGMHFQLDAQSAISALAAGQVVAARFPVTPPAEGNINRDDVAGTEPSARFVLMRHELFYQRRAQSDRLDYDQEPLRIYTLYMHLGAPTGMSLDNVVAANPVWLNRLLTMKKEYDLGLTFHNTHQNPAAQWTPHVTRWQRRQRAIDAVLANLRAGRVAVFPEGDDAIRVALGDLLGVAGHLDQNASGVHLEVFSRDVIADANFVQIDRRASAARPYHDERNLDEVTDFIKTQVQAPANGIGAASVYRDLPSEQKATRFQRIALLKKSEWALAQADFPAGGWTQAQPLMWWSEVVPTMNAALAAEASAQLPVDAVVWHYHPLGILSFVNGIVWKSEWPKYRIVDAAGANEPVPVRPPRRR